MSLNKESKLLEKWLNFYWKPHCVGKGMQLFILLAMGQIVSLLFHKDSFGNKQPIKVDMLLNKETKTKTNQWSILIFKNSYATLKIIKKRICKIVDFALPADRRIKLKECEKKDKYVDLARELKKLWNMKMTIVVVVIGAFVIY